MLKIVELGGRHELYIGMILTVAHPSSLKEVLTVAHAITLLKINMAADRGPL